MAAVPPGRIHVPGASITEMVGSRYVVPYEHGGHSSTQLPRSGVETTKLEIRGAGTSAAPVATPGTPPWFSRGLGGGIRGHEPVRHGDGSQYSLGGDGGNLGGDRLGLGRSAAGEAAVSQHGQARDAAVSRPLDDAPRYAPTDWQRPPGRPLVDAGDSWQRHEAQATAGGQVRAVAPTPSNLPTTDHSWWRDIAPRAGADAGHAAGPAPGSFRDVGGGGTHDAGRGQVPGASGGSGSTRRDLLRPWEGAAPPQGGDAGSYPDGDPGSAMPLKPSAGRNPSADRVFQGSSGQRASTPTHGSDARPFVLGDRAPSAGEMYVGGWVQGHLGDGRRPGVEPALSGTSSRPYGGEAVASRSRSNEDSRGVARDQGAPLSPPAHVTRATGPPSDRGAYGSNYARWSTPEDGANVRAVSDVRAVSFMGGRGVPDRATLERSMRAEGERWGRVEGGAEAAHRPWQEEGPAARASRQAQEQERGTHQDPRDSGLSTAAGPREKPRSSSVGVGAPDCPHDKQPSGDKPTSAAQGGVVPLRVSGEGPKDVAVTAGRHRGDNTRGGVDAEARDYAGNASARVSAGHALAAEPAASYADVSTTDVGSTEDGYAALGPERESRRGSGGMGGADMPSTRRLIPDSSAAAAAGGPEAGGDAHARVSTDSLQLQAHEARTSQGGDPERDGQRGQHPRENGETRQPGPGWAGDGSAPPRGRGGAEEGASAGRSAAEGDERRAGDGRRGRDPRGAEAPPDAQLYAQLDRDMAERQLAAEVRRRMQQMQTLVVDAGAYLSDSTGVLRTGPRAGGSSYDGDDYQAWLLGGGEQTIRPQPQAARGALAVDGSLPLASDQGSLVPGGAGVLARDRDLVALACEVQSLRDEVALLRQRNAEDASSQEGAATKLASLQTALQQARADKARLEQQVASMSKKHGAEMTLQKELSETLVKSLEGQLRTLAEQKARMAQERDASRKASPPSQEGDSERASLLASLRALQEEHEAMLAHAATDKAKWQQELSLASVTHEQRVRELEARLSLAQEGAAQLAAEVAAERARWAQEAVAAAEAGARQTTTREAKVAELEAATDALRAELAAERSARLAQQEVAEAEARSLRCAAQKQGEQLEEARRLMEAQQEAAARQLEECRQVAREDKDRAIQVLEAQVQSLAQEKASLEQESQAAIAKLEAGLQGTVAYTQEVEGCLEQWEGANRVCAAEQERMAEGYEEKIRQLAASKDQLAASLEAMSGELAAATARLHKGVFGQEELVESLQRQLASTQEQLRQAEEQAALLATAREQGAVEASPGGKGDDVAAVAWMQEVLAEREDEVSRLRQRCAHLERDEEHHKERAAEHAAAERESSEQLRAAMEAQEGALASARAENEELRALMEQIKGQLARNGVALRQANQEKADAVADASAAVQRLEAQLAVAAARQQAVAADVEGEREQLATQVEVLSSSLRACQGRLDKANAELKSVEERAGYFAACCEDLQGELAGAQGQLADAGAQLEHAQALQQRQEALRQEAEGRVAQLEQQVAVLSQQAEALPMLQERCLAADQSLDALRAGLDDQLQQQAASFQREMDAQRSAMDAQRSALESRAEREAARAEEAEARAVALAARHTAAEQEQIRVLAAVREELASAAQEHARATATWHAEEASLRAHLRDLSQENEAQAGEIDRLREQVPYLQQELEAAAAQIDRLSDAHAALTEQARAGAALMAEGERERGRLAAALEEAQADAQRVARELAAATQQLGERSTQLEEARAVYARVEMAKGEAEAAVAALQQETQRLHAEVSSLSQKLEELEGQLAGAQEEAEVKDLHNRMLSDSLSAAEAQLREREAEAGKASADAEASRRKLQAAVDEGEGARLGLKDVQAKCAALAGELEQRRLVCTQLEEEARTLRDARDMLEHAEQRRKDAEGELAAARRAMGEQSTLVQELRARVAALEGELLEKEGTISILQDAMHPHDSSFT
eukprot:jgi/Mesvir1/2381/Mv22133-RA.1